MQFRIIIPARYGSTRLPGKPLLLIRGKPLIEHVYRRACASNAAEIVIATDDPRIADVATNLGAKVCMTGSHHHSGSDRIAEALSQLAWSDDTCVVNVQGDEPCMPAALINQVAIDLYEHPDAAMSTVAAKICKLEHVFDYNIVKVVTDIKGYALYFSRAPIPWHRDALQTHPTPLLETINMRRHIGLYAYKAGFLRQYVTWPVSPIECAESLEQLRVLWHGKRIYVGSTSQEPGPGVDVPYDIVKIESLLLAGNCG